MIFPAGYGNCRFLYMLGEHTLQFCELSSLLLSGTFIWNLTPLQVVYYQTITKYMRLIMMTLFFYNKRNPDSPAILR